MPYYPEFRIIRVRINEVLLYPIEPINYLSIACVELQDKQRLQEREMSRHTVQLEGLRIKLEQRTREYEDMKSKVRVGLI